MAFASQVRDTLVPGGDPEHGPLPPLLVALTVVTGLVDAFSYLLLGHVFVANMTGNVVLLGFALAGAPGFSIAASLVSIAFFGVGALAGGRIGAHFTQHRDHLLTAAATVQAGFVATALTLALLSGNPVPNGFRYALIATLAIAMGIQNAAVRRLAVPDLTTTVLTMTLTGIAADSAAAGGRGSRAGRRLVAVIAMLAGAVAGAELVLRVHIADPLVIVLVVLVTTALVARASGHGGPAWVRGG